MAAFIYRCVCHGQIARKDAVPEIAKKNMVKGDTRADKGSLGSWRCPVSNKKTKVARERNRPKEAAA